ncbi:MAG: hypothetical protein JWR18_604 [Segetibacter sp.]|jgi:hypothetical protein|nr:hypothetical protein [Segetibacter sp.]
MNTKLLMAVSAFVLGVAGIALSFLPQEVATFCGLHESNSIVLQISGALYLGFAVLNRTAKGNLIGGIYSKPVAIANFAHFLIGGLALLKPATKGTGISYIWIPTVIYLAFAILFGYVFLFNPLLKTKLV